MDGTTPGGDKPSNQTRGTDQDTTQVQIDTSSKGQDKTVTPNTSDQTQVSSSQHTKRYQQTPSQVVLKTQQLLDQIRQRRKMVAQRSIFKKETESAPKAITAETTPASTDEGKQPPQQTKVTPQTHNGIGKFVKKVAFGTGQSVETGKGSGGLLKGKSVIGGLAGKFISSRFGS